VLAEGAVVGRIFKANAAPVGSRWKWTLAFDFRGDRTPNPSSPKQDPLGREAARVRGPGTLYCQAPPVKQLSEP
jgi:hypothetical protein